MLERLNLFGRYGHPTTQNRAQKADGREKSPHDSAYGRANDWGHYRGRRLWNGDLGRIRFLIRATRFRC